MRTLATLLGGLLCVAAAGACASGGGPSTGDGEFVVDFDAAIRGMSRYANVRGAARAVATLGTTAVTVDLQGGVPGSRHPWHIHYGRCGSGGSIVGSAAAYPPLEPDAEGSDRATTTLGVQLDDDTRYHVNVHLSAEEMDVVIACGNLVD